MNHSYFHSSHLLHLLFDSINSSLHILHQTRESSTIFPRTLDTATKKHLHSPPSRLLHFHFFKYKSPSAIQLMFLTPIYWCQSHLLSNSPKSHSSAKSELQIPCIVNASLGNPKPNIPKTLPRKA